MIDAQKNDLPLIGLGLRHPHFEDALTSSAAVDFVEVHSENFFAKGGALHQILADIAAKYPVSLHSTAMGLGSDVNISESYLEKLQAIVEIAHPFLLSDHACFTWGLLQDKLVHAGDLLPILFNKETLQTMTDNVDFVQQKLGRSILIENLSAYLELPGSTWSEPEFLVRLTEKTQCGLLVDLNNLLVNAHNIGHQQPLQYAQQWLEHIPADCIGEFHLAGYSDVADNTLAVDDHSQPVSDTCWSVYQYALKTKGAKPTLIEWDNELPDWNVLTRQAVYARKVAATVFEHD